MKIKLFKRPNLPYGIIGIVVFTLISLILLQIPCNKGSFLILSLCSKDIIFVIMNLLGSLIVGLIFFNKSTFSNQIYLYLSIIFNIPMAYLIGVGFGKIFQKFKKIVMLILLLFSLAFIQIEPVNAEINTEISVYQIEDNGNFVDLAIGDLEIRYFFDTGESIRKSTNTGETVVTDLANELFCWKRCNIVPQRTIERIEVYDSTELLSIQDVSITENNVNQLINIVKDEKIELNRPIEDNIPQQYIDTISKEIETGTELLIYWEGSIIIDDENSYEFLVDVGGGLAVYIDGILIYSNSSSNGAKIFSADLTEGNHSIVLTYFTHINSTPNLYWQTDDSGNYSVILDDTLLYSKGLIRSIVQQPLMRQLSISSIPESYTPDYGSYPTYSLYFFQKTPDRIPTLMVHGLNGKYPYWNRMHSKLNDKDNDIWSFYYSPANVSNFMTAGLLKSGINQVSQYYQSSKLDVVSHSMGGLVTLGYIQNLGKSSSGIQINYDNNIRKYVIIAAPLHGAYLSNRVLMGETNIATCPIVEWFADPSDPYAQAYLDLAVGSEYTWLLNAGDLNNDIEYLAITGNEGILCVPDETKESGSGDPGAGNDGLVAVSSASMLNKGIPLIIIDEYNHANEIGQAYTCLGAIGCAGHCQNYLFGILCSDVDKEVNIVNAFLNDEDIDTITDYLDDADDYYIDPEDADSNPFGRGSVILKVIPGELVDSVKLRNTDTEEVYSLTEFEDIRHDTNTDNWYYFSDDNESIGYSSQKYGLTFPEGNYEILINDESNGEYLEIYGAQTTMQHIIIPTCDDTIQNGDETGVDCGGSCITEDEELCNGIDDNHNCDTDENLQRECSENYLGNCAIGVENCNLGIWQGCPMPQAESCEGSDEDCDGISDGSEGLTRQCGVANVGICTFGIETCNNEGNYINCDAVFPEEEICENGVDEDCNGIDDPCLEVPLIHSPVENSVWEDRRVLINVSVKKVVKYIKYQLDGKISRNGEPMYMTLCSDCDHIEKSVSMLDGNHTLGVVTINEDDRQFEDSVKFMIDSKEPRISKTEPKRGYSDGNFYVEFKEDNPINVTLHYGNSIRQKPASLEDCYEVRRGTSGCNVFADVEDFDGNDIEYWFTIEDISGNVGESRHEELTVDTSAPIINDFDYFKDERYVTFTLDITEQNLDKIEYIDLNDSRSRWKTLCSRLDGSICEKRVSFSDGKHYVVINITDEAGNYNSTNASFFTDSKDPKISKTEPRGGWADGNFYVEFDEANPDVLYLNYGNSIVEYRNSKLNLSKCPLDRRGFYCTHYVDLDDYDTQEIEYWFNITDLIGNIDESKPIFLSVDTTEPIVNDYNIDVDGRSVTFTIDIEEINFDEASYIDYEEGDRARFRRLCSRLDDDICEKRIYFRSGDHDIGILILDEAGNNATIEGITFTT